MEARGGGANTGTRNIRRRRPRTIKSELVTGNFAREADNAPACLLLVGLSDFVVCCGVEAQLGWLVVKKERGKCRAGLGWVAAAATEANRPTARRVLEGDCPKCPGLCVRGSVDNQSAVEAFGISQAGSIERAMLEWKKDLRDVGQLPH
ncbi:hypothetical protein GGTG_13377 [Gaeumannomyces tritici R3-111a-1]|uniref:Uncharacterized protein n=1 Tax=Gaeumannomyces tritici (strain R3-111a-1) TaxID=644352 RepID=J3PIP8_GAET3|nr:hypothetical protein GGTG_13377 [Gaeumannomyces tritici R3-111a-1]EJT69109.1 hypothetical protein GGTG_13377 [Gaeumannomyces tritici R3-111a-1]